MMIRNLRVSIMTMILTNESDISITLIIRVTIMTMLLTNDSDIYELLPTNWGSDHESANRKHLPWDGESSNHVEDDLAQNEAVERLPPSPPIGQLPSYQTANQNASHLDGGQQRLDIFEVTEKVPLRIRLDGVECNGMGKIRWRSAKLWLKSIGVDWKGVKWSLPATSWM